MHESEETKIVKSETMCRVYHNYKECERCMHDLAFYGEAIWDQVKQEHINVPNIIVMVADKDTFPPSMQAALTARFDK